MPHLTHIGFRSFFTTSKQPKFKVRALVSFFGPSNLLTLKEKGRSSEKSPEARLIGEVPAETSEIPQKASPVYYVSKKSPPTILLHGTNDKNVPHVQSQEFTKLLQAEGVYNELYSVSGTRHSDPVFDSEEYVSKVIEFLEINMPVKQK